ncbi:MAG: hypothetical protein HN390_06835 [Anaerolineae bacterium]|jgi:uncharacterized membrane protein YczE|nr:hypothetical protein [Anaerolineae bacterium]MBT7189515.1 hypothetical protein [Anaerolineae bacterium]MBT7988889.1 hypothetical protein [Anaerolineae bacterium]
MFKPINWETFPRDFLRIQIGFALFGLSIALLIQGNLGTGAWGVLEVGLSYLLHVTPGTMTVASGFVVLTGALLMREQIGWGTLGNILSIGPWLDLALSFVPSVENNLLLQIPMLLAAILMMGFASAIYIGVNAGAGPRDSLMLGLKRTTGLSVRKARTIIEVTVVTIGGLIGGPVGIGTVVFALLIGPAVQWGFKIFKVEPHKEKIIESQKTIVE